MLRSLYVLLDYHIRATDGLPGTVADFLFDDETWMIHYLVAETLSPVGKRKGLILPFALGRPDWQMKRLPVQLTSDQVRDSPPIESDLPLSKQLEIGSKRPGSHLRSMREVLGYQVHTGEGEAGSFEDLIIEDTLWGVHHLVVALKHPSVRSVLLPPSAIRSISWPGKTAWANLSRADLERSPAFDPSEPVNHDEQERQYDYLGRLVRTAPKLFSARCHDSPRH